jgi:ABC-type sugar transport system permease subunit
LIYSLGQQKAYLRLVCAGGLALPFLFLLPPLLRVDRFSDAISYMLTPTVGASEDFIGAMLRTVAVSLATAIGASLLGLIAALATLEGNRGLSRATRILLILPFFLGEAVLAFVFRQALQVGSNPAQTTDWPSVSALAIIVALQVLRLGCLFAVVFASLIYNADRQGVDFACVHGLSRNRFVRDVVLPPLTVTFQLLCCMAFVVATVENAIAGLVFRASPGNGLELLGHWASRQYNMMAVSSPGGARDVITLFSCLEFVLTLFLGLLLFLLARPVVGIATMFESASKSALRLLRPRWHEVAALLLLRLFAILLVCGVFGIAIVHWSEVGRDFFLRLPHLVSTILLGILTGGLSTLLAASLAIACSMAWPSSFSHPSRLAVLVLVSALLLSAVPHNYLLLATYDWAFGILQTRAETAAWMIGHTSLLLPLLFAFFIVTHLSIRSEEIDFQWVHRVSFRQFAVLSYGRRFAGSYLLGALCAFALLWNEHAVNSTFSSSVPSFASELTRALDGRVASIGAASLYSVTSLLIGLILASALSTQFQQKRKSVTR